MRPVEIRIGIIVRAPGGYGRVVADNMGSSSAGGDAERDGDVESSDIISSSDSVSAGSGLLHDIVSISGLAQRASIFFHSRGSVKHPVRSHCFRTLSSMDLAHIHFISHISLNSNDLNFISFKKSFVL